MELGSEEKIRRFYIATPQEEMIPNLARKVITCILFRFEMFFPVRPPKKMMTVIYAFITPG